MSIISYIIVGSGFRAEYYGRIANTYPNLFRAMFMCRSEQKAEYISKKMGIPATTSIEECKRFNADFAVIAVSKDSVASVCEQWVERGYPVLAETPVGASVEELRRLWKLHEAGARITVSEQYHRYPLLYGGLDAVAKGKIGAPQSAYISLVHYHHAASLLRRALFTHNEQYVLRGECYKGSVVLTDSRQEAITDGSKAPEYRNIIVGTFASGKTFVYDFCGVQYRSFIRSRHLIVRGERGEWNDNIIYCLDDDNQPKHEYLLPTIPKKYSALDTQYLKDARKAWQSELLVDTRQDEFAVATMLMDMGDYINGGKEIYPLSEALDDAYFCLLMEQAIASPQTEIKSQPMPWNINI